MTIVEFLIVPTCFTQTTLRIGLSHAPVPKLKKLLRCERFALSLEPLQVFDGTRLRLELVLQI